MHARPDDHYLCSVVVVLLVVINECVVIPGVLANTLLHMGVAAGDLLATDGEGSVVDQMKDNLALNRLDPVCIGSGDVHSASASTSASAGHPSPCHSLPPALGSCACHVVKWGDAGALTALPPFWRAQHESQGEGERQSQGEGEGGGVDVIFATDVVFGDQRVVWRALGATLAQACQQRQQRSRTRASVEAKAANNVSGETATASATATTERASSHELGETIVFIAQVRGWVGLLASCAAPLLASLVS